MKKDPKLHLGHYGRVRTRVQQTDIHQITEELAMEMLLQCPMRRGDTNETAKRILDKFGSFNKFCRLASYDKLIEIEGVGSAVAEKLLCLCKLFLFSKYHLENKIEDKLVNFSAITQFLHQLYSDAETEIFVLLVLNHRRQVTHYSILSQGTINNVSVDLDKIAELTRLHKGSMIIISHNHPDGSFYPSIEDISTTEKVFAFCKMRGITFLDHIVMNKDGYFSFYCSHLLDSIERRMLEKIRGRRVIP